MEEKITIRISGKDKNILKEEAKESRLALSSYIRSKLFKK